jgi:hypothetical protein
MAQSSTKAQREEIQNIMVEVARTELAAVGAALKFWGGWVQSAEKYSQKLSAELEKVSEDEGVSQKFVGNLTDLTREYLREIVALPTVAFEHFSGEMQKISKPAAKRARRARAKN